MEESNLNLNFLGLKAESKNEIYRLLTVKAELYLPPQKKNIYIFCEGCISWKQEGKC